ncbi:MAG TPA: transglutaminase family protein [Stellaceae bacterium]|nr:transglutaminase family protein [Stellaceae bacterium]
MRLRVRHQTTYRYERPVPYSIQTLRVSPRSYEGLAVLRWSVRGEAKRELPSLIDGFGNLIHCHTITEPHTEMTLLVEGEVDTTDTVGVIRGAAETLPPAYYLRRTELTAPHPLIAALAADVMRESNTLARLHRLMGAVRDDMEYQLGITEVHTPAGEALQHGAGVCQDHAHVFIAAARTMAIPARYIGGYLWTGEEERDHDASHAWAEAYVEDLGWVGFDPANRICPTASYIRASVGLDYWSAAPVRGIRRGGSAETLAVKVTVGSGEQ